MTAEPAPAISIIVPVYNVERHVAAALQSLQAQTFTDFEALVIDDGSTDESGRLARDICDGDPRFHYIHQENRGLSGARNTGLDRAQGALIGFLDSDDRLMADALWQMHRALEDHGADWVACAVRYIGPTGRGNVHSAIQDAPALSNHAGPRRYPFETVSDVTRHFPSAWNKLYRRTLIEGLRFDEGTWFEDHSFFHRVAARTDHILHLPQTLYLQTQGRDGQITAADDDRIFEQFTVLKALRTEIETAGRSGGEAAFGTLASRLVAERSRALRDPARRARFLEAAKAFFADQGMRYQTAPETGIHAALELEMAGRCPISIVVPWRANGAGGPAEAALAATLQSLQDAHPIGMEVLLAGDPLPPALAAQFSRLQHHDGPIAKALEHALGTGTLILAPGDRVTPWGLHILVDSLWSRDADLILTGSQIKAAGGAEEVYSDGIRDRGDVPNHLERQDVAPETLVHLDAAAITTFWKTSFLQKQSRYVPAPWDGWSRHALLYGIGSQAGRISYIKAPTAIYEARLPSRDLGALLRSLPETLSPALRARLFTRALRESLDHMAHEGTGRRARLTLAAKAALLARRHRLRDPGPEALDGNINARTRRLINPFAQNEAVSVPAHYWMESTGDPEDLDDPIAQEITPETLFPMAGRGRLKFRAFFREHENANLSFFAPGPIAIPFHLSLRAKEGCIVVNDRHADGTWRAERAVPYAFTQESLVVEISFEAGGARVSVEGAEVFRLNRWRPWERGGLRRISAITAFGRQGDLRIMDMALDLPKGALLLDDRLTLRGKGAAEDVTLLVGGSSAADLIVTPTLALQESDAKGWEATLPGRVWANIEPDQALEISLSRKGKKVASLTLARAEIAERLTAALQAPLPAEDSLLALCALEHLQDTAIFAALPPKAQNQARHIAEHYGLSRSLPPLETPPKPEIDPYIEAIDATTARFAQSQRARPAPDPMQVLDDLALAEPWAQQGVLLALSEVFCREEHDTMGFAARAQNLPPFQVAGDGWTNSAMIPFLFYGGRNAELIEALDTLKTPGSDWVLTPPLAFLMRQIGAASPLDAKQRRKMLIGILRFMVARRGEYAERLACRELTRAAAYLLSHPGALPPLLMRDYKWFTAPDIETFLLEIYGLSRVFWEAVDGPPDTGSILPKTRQTGAVFRALEKAMAAGDKAAAESLLSHPLLATLDDAPRWRRDLFGPAGTLAPSEATLTALPGKPAFAALRLLAHPETEPDCALNALARPAIPELYEHLEGVGRNASPKALRAVADAARAAYEAPDGSATTRFLAAAAHLTDRSAGHLGLGLALALATEPDRTDRAQLLDWFQAHLPSESAGFDPSAPPLQAAAARADLRGAADVAERLPAEVVPARLPDNPDPLPDLVHDAIVVVFSCRAYLETRLPVLRATWLADLEARGIPWIVVVGDGDNSQDGPIVALDAPDDYEGLPQKTLAAIRWVAEKTGYGHMVKIDDDCFLNADELFGTLTYRQHHYYGRRLTRIPGSMDRAWHQPKSTSARARAEFDRSPEPSTYADGGSGYVLSRHAMVTALAMAESPEGRRLRAVSYMEDKMLGDLLSLAGIIASEIDYRVAIWRRSHGAFDGAALPVPAWLNSFLPGPEAPITLAHLDHAALMPRAMEALRTPGLSGAKIWPSWQEVKLGHESNTLDLLSPLPRFEAAKEAAVAVVAVMRNEAFMLDAFLAHYRRLGVSAFLIADNGSDDGTREKLLEAEDVALFSVDTDYNKSEYGVAWQQAMLSAARVGKWTVVADADELIFWQREQTQTLPDLLAGPDFAEAEAARLFMVDMYPKGPLEQATFETGDPFAEAPYVDRDPFLTASTMAGPYSDAPAWTSALRHRLLPGTRPNTFTAQKIALLKYQPWMRLSAGLHFVGDARLSPRELFFGHFKYNAAFRAKAAAEAARGQHWGGAEEYRKYLALAAEGRSVVYDASASVLWYESPFVAGRLE